MSLPEAWKEARVLSYIADQKVLEVQIIGGDAVFIDHPFDNNYQKGDYVLVAQSGTGWWVLVG